MPPSNGHVKPKAEPLRQVALYDYRDEAGGIVLQVVRYEPKTFRQRTPDGSGKWKWSAKDARVVPFRLDKLTEAPGRTVVVVEGRRMSSVSSTSGSSQPATREARQVDVGTCSLPGRPQRDHHPGQRQARPGPCHARRSIARGHRRIRPDRHVAWPGHQRPGRVRLDRRGWDAGRAARPGPAHA